MTPILIKSFARTYELDARWSETALAYLRCAPDMPGGEQPTTRLAIEQNGPLGRTKLLSGETIEGSPQWIAHKIEGSILVEAMRGLADRLVLPASILRTANGRRALFVADWQTDRSWLTLSLLLQGWHFEGDSFVLATASGLMAYPRPLQVFGSLRRFPQPWRAFLVQCPTVSIDSTYRGWAIDPTRLGARWTLQTGPVDAVFLMSRNEGARGGLQSVAQDDVFRAALRLARGPVNARSLGALHACLSGPKFFRLSLGDFDHAVARIGDVMEG